MSHMKLKKKSNKKNKYKYKIMLIIMIIYVVFAYTFYNSFKNNKDISNEKFIKFLLNNGNSNFTYEYKIPSIINNTISYFLKIDFTKPETLFNGSILGYTEDDLLEYSNLEELKEVSHYMSDPNNVDIDNPLVYIYNSHQLENYNNDNLEIYGITPNVLMASYLLKEKLNERGISTIVEDTNMTEFLELNNWDYSNSYRASRIFMLDKKNTYSSLKYFIDIHRDSVNWKLSTVTVGNRDYARILFVVGLEHKNYQKNLDLANDINDLFNKYYSGLSRGVLTKQGESVNGIYNQDISSNVMLIEVGGVDNNIDEVLNTINAISHVLSIYIGDNNV